MANNEWDLVNVLSDLRASSLPVLDEASRRFLNEDPKGWAANRRCQLEEAIKSVDKEKFNLVLKEYAAVVGKENAINLVLIIWELTIP